VRLSWSPEFRLLVVWTLKGKDFVCVEPWTAAAGALATGEGLLHVAPGERTSLAFDIEA
jgi:galactose mutarotase-like enzyme